MTQNHGLLLFPGARFTKKGEYLCCSQCFRSVRNDKLNRNPIMVEDDNSIDEETENPNIEKHIEIQYWFMPSTASILASFGFFDVLRKE
jgi:hypothetical protein